MNSVRLDLLAQRIQEHRAGKGIREAAGEVGVSPATLSRVENGKAPDLETFSKICRWLGEDPSIYLGLTPAPSRTNPTALVHFKKGPAVRNDSAKALGQMKLVSPLPKLPIEAVDLINQGVWTLYALRGHAAEYLLVADNGGTFYYLDRDGGTLDTTEDARFDPPTRSQIADVIRFATESQAGA